MYKTFCNFSISFSRSNAMNLFSNFNATATLSTGITDFAPLYNAVAIVEVARSTSIITTMLLLISYRCNKAGEREVKRVGLFYSSGKYNKGYSQRRLLQQCSPFISFGILLYYFIAVIDQFFKIRIQIKFIYQLHRSSHKEFHN